MPSNIFTPAMMLDVSDDDIGAAAETLRTALRALALKQLHWFYATRPDLQHSTIYVGASPRVLRRLLPVERKQASTSLP
jgi:hypothetical protein